VHDFLARRQTSCSSCSKSTASRRRASRPQ
jgi:hypothetical protein